MAKKNNTTETMGFVFTEASEAKASTGRTIPGSTELISICNQKALDAIKLASTDKDVAGLATDVQTGNHEALVKFVEATVEVPSAEMLAGATDDELSRLLESRRSDRSKAKKAGLMTIDSLRRYISAWIAELVIRESTGKAYKAPSATAYGEFESTDSEEITKKIKSLQSKKCRLNAQAKMCLSAGIETPENIRNELAEVEAEITRLNAMRGTTPRTAKVKTVDVVPTNEQLRAALAGMSAEELQALLAQAAG